MVFSLLNVKKFPLLKRGKKIKSEALKTRKPLKTLASRIYV